MPIKSKLRFDVRHGRTYENKEQKMQQHFNKRNKQMQMQTNMRNNNRKEYENNIKVPRLL